MIRDIAEELKKAVEASSFKDEFEKVFLFGSYLHSDIKPDSEVDVLAELKPSAKVGFLKFVGIEQDLASKLKRKVDLEIIWKTTQETYLICKNKSPKL